MKSTISSRRNVVVMSAAAIAAICYCKSRGGNEKAQSHLTGEQNFFLLETPSVVNQGYISEAATDSSVLKVLLVKNENEKQIKMPERLVLKGARTQLDDQLLWLECAQIRDEVQRATLSISLYLRRKAQGEAVPLDPESFGWKELRTASEKGEITDPRKAIRTLTLHERQVASLFSRAKGFARVAEFENYLTEFGSGPEVLSQLSNILGTQEDKKTGEPDEPLNGPLFKKYPSATDTIIELRNERYDLAKSKLCLLYAKDPLTTKKTELRQLIKGDRETNFRSLLEKVKTQPEYFRTFLEISSDNYEDVVAALLLSDLN